jgi:alpha-tubulin suppressor-like RCC1 family protein
VTGLAGVLSLAGGGAHSCAILSNGGSVQCWGANGDGQLGNGTRTQSTTPVIVTGLTNAVKLATGKSDGCAVTVGGGVQCWGWFGPALTEGAHRPTLAPAKIMLASSGAELVGARDLVSGGGHACVRRAGDSAVFCWGNNADGELGAATGTCGGARGEGYACSPTAVAIAWP